jgi:integrase
MARKRKVTRRPRGFGSVYRLPDGRFQAEVPYYTSKGGTRVRRFKRRVCASEAEANAAVTQLQRELGLMRIEDTTTIADLAAIWVDLTVVPRNLSPGTLSGYEDDLMRALKIIGALSIQEVTQHGAIVLDRAIADLTRSGYGARAVRRTVARLRAMFDFALERNMIVRNPARTLTLPKIVETSVYPWTIATLNQLLRQVAGTSRAALYYLAARTGMREGELLGLTWANIDAGTGRLVVNRAIRAFDQSVAKPKTRKGTRTLYLSRQVLDVLDAHREVTRRRRLVSTTWQEHDLVFPSRNGRALRASNMIRRFKLDLADAKLPPEIHFHDFRHFFRELIAEKVPPHVVTDLMGHEDTSTSFEVYGRHVSEQAKHAAAAVLDEAFGEVA